MQDSAMIRADRVMADADSSSLDIAEEYAALVGSYRKLLRKLHKTIVISDSYQGRLKELMKLLEETTRKYRQLKDVALPICMYCKKVRSDNNYWQQLETYFGTHADIMFSNGICPDCIDIAYNQLGKWMGKEPLPNVPARGGKPPQRGSREPAEDDLLKEIRAIHRQSALDGNPLAPELERIMAGYGKLLRRFNKTVSISDGYQFQLMDFKARLEITARTDLLTGLANRWEIMARMESEKSRAERYGKTFSVLICDLDHFKGINDTHGHLAGDRILKAIAETLRANTRTEDSCGRWGGEEFLIILPEIDLEKGCLVAEKLLSAVRQTEVLWEGQRISVTMSVGVGTFRDGMSIDECIKLVDDALYAAKHGGRDRFFAVGEYDRTPP